LGLGGCVDRIETGQVGIRINMSKEIQPGELMPGSWNQTVVGNVITFPVKDVTMQIDNKTPLTADNSALEDFDLNVVYSINPTSVSELYSKKARSFHYVDKDGDIFLMFNYLVTLVNNAAYKTVRKYKSLEVADNRQVIEQEIVRIVNEGLKDEGLDKDLNITVVQVRNIQPNKAIMQAATEYVKSQNELKIKETEVQIAKKEAERMQALAHNSAQSIAYMNAQAALNISEGIKAGKVQTIIVPSNFTGLMMK
jgi:hypothetical protein